jgi:hypothetical protein
MCRLGWFHDASHDLMQKSSTNALPGRLSVSIGGYFGPSYGVKPENGRLTYLPARRDMGEDRLLVSEDISPSADQWREFRAALDRQGVWNCEANYHNPGICDGTSWSLEIAYSDKAIVSGGTNCFPGESGRAISIVDLSKDDTFHEFCSVVSALVGGEFR